MTSFKLINDVKRISRTDALYKAYINSEFSVVYVLLLTSSVGICTLGLLLGYSPVVIGGMLIAPLMWPLMKGAVGISSEDTKYIKEAIATFLISTILGIMVASIIAYISPIKVLTSEIIARTNPTLLDIFVALMAGGIAALAISQPRISDSIAGVAIATSLLPPLCVGGIGLALSNTSIFYKGLLLYFANAVSIIFIATITFSSLKIKYKADGHIRKTGVFLTLILLILTAIPLFVFLRQYSFETVAYNDIRLGLETDLKQISPNIYIDDFKTSLSPDREKIIVEASILLPENITLDYEHMQKLRSSLESATGKPVDLNFRLQTTLSIVTEEDKVKEDKVKKLRGAFLAQIEKTDDDLSISTIDISFDERTSVWKVKSVLRSDPNLVFTTYQKDLIELGLEEVVSEDVSLNLEIIPRILIESTEVKQSSSVRETTSAYEY